MSYTKIQKGDKIQIDANGNIITGAVTSAIDWGDEQASDWYIEFDGEDGPCYIKEQYDRKTCNGNLTIKKL